MKDGTKLPIYFIFKGVTPATDGKEPRSNSLAYEFKYRSSDSNDNPYPPEDKAVLTCAPKANSNQFLTKDILEKVIFPGIGINEGLRGGVLVDDFKAHSASVVKDFTTKKRSGNDSMPDEQRYNLCEFRIMAGGITPKSQPIDAFIGKLMKGYYKEFYDSYSISAPTNPDTGHPKPPSRQLCAQWVVAAFDKIPEELIRKAWLVCGYKTQEQIKLEERNNSLNSVALYLYEDAISELAAAAGGGDIGASVSSILLNPEYEYETSVDENSEPVEGDLDAHGTWDIGK